MTIQGALNDLSNLINSSDIPIYYKPSLKKIKETIELEIQPKMGEWILCDTQLPPKDKNVLVTRMYKGKPYVEIAEWNDGWTSYSDEYKVDYFTEHQVVAWMPLPEAYEEESEE